MNRVIYPKYDFVENYVPSVEDGIDTITYHCQLSTYIRKKENNKWYLIPVVCRYENNESDPGTIGILHRSQFRSECVDSFNNQCYNTLINYKIKMALELEKKGDGKWSLGILVDTNQQSEEDRTLGRKQFNLIKVV